MKQTRQALKTIAAGGLCCVRQAFLTMLREERGVTAIEYALLASLIVVGASASIALLGGGVEGMWGRVASAVAAAM